LRAIDHPIVIDIFGSCLSIAATVPIRVTK